MCAMYCTSYHSSMASTDSRVTPSDDSHHSDLTAIHDGGRLSAPSMTHSRRVCNGLLSWTTAAACALPGVGLLDASAVMNGCMAPLRSYAARILAVFEVLLPRDSDGRERLGADLAPLMLLGRRARDAHAQDVCVA